MADTGPKTEQEWAHRYELEKVGVLAEEILADSYTNFFHKCANGRRRKQTIRGLECEGAEITGAKELKQHITEYYKMLFGREEVANIQLDENTWDVHQKISEKENAELTKPFTLEELDAVVKDI